VEVTGLLAALVKEPILKQSDMMIVDEVPRAENLGRIVAEKDVDVVLTSLSGMQVPTAYQNLVFSFPHVAVVAISADRRRVEVYDRKVVREKVVREVAPEQLLEVIREAVHNRENVRGIAKLE
jgi:DNA-binding NarL/FixJ family response regulator